METNQDPNNTTAPVPPINKPFYKKWWFLAIVGLILLIMLLPKGEGTPQTADSTQQTKPSSIFRREGDKIYVDADIWGKDYPLSVRNGILTCEEGAVFFTSGTKKYGVNGVGKTRARQNGMNSIDEIWLDKKDGLPSEKADLGDLLEQGKSLCK